MASNGRPLTLGSVTPCAGCNGGDQLPALEWIADKTSGLCTEAEWPCVRGWRGGGGGSRAVAARSLLCRSYTSGDGLNGKCTKTCTNPTPIKQGIEVVKGNETALMAAIAMQPM